MRRDINSLKYVLKKQINDRVKNLPEGYSPRIWLDVTDRGYIQEFVQECIKDIQIYLSDIYPEIPITVFGA